jgi:hypothetical protein
MPWFNNGKEIVEVSTLTELQLARRYNWTEVDGPEEKVATPVPEKKVAPKKKATARRGKAVTMKQMGG